jgi:hypothetical protein
LHNPEAVVEWEVGVEPPSKVGIKAFERSTSATGMTTTSNFISTFAASAALAGSLLIALKVAIFFPPVALRESKVWAN